jgi:hypothetical protein
MDNLTSGQSLGGSKESVGAFGAGIVRPTGWEIDPQSLPIRFLIVLR